MTEEELNRLVLERARKQVEERKSQAPAPPRAPKELPEDRAGLWMLIGVTVAMAVGLMLFLPGSFVDRLGWIVHGVCSQEHTLNIGGVEMPLCQRNTGIYAGFLATLLTLIALGRSRAGALPQPSILALMVFNVLWMGSDGFNSLLKDIGNYHLYEPQPVLRILSGLAMGMTMGALMLFAFNITLRSDVRRFQPVIGGWREVGIIALVELALFTLIRLNQPWLIYPLAIFSTLGIIGVMFTVNLVIVAMVARYDQGMTRLRQLARPAIFALILTALEFGGLAWMRAALMPTM